MRVDIPLRYDLYEGGYPVNPWSAVPLGGLGNPWGTPSRETVTTLGLDPQGGRFYPFGRIL